MSRTPSGQEERRRENILPTQTHREKELGREEGHWSKFSAVRKGLIVNERERLREILKWAGENHTQLSS